MSAASTAFKPRWRRLATRCFPRKNASGGIGAACGRKNMPKNKPSSLTTPDLVLLSLLAERPMHGYQANTELERREWRDWVDISRPQLYYSMEKLARSGMIAVAKTGEPSGGPDRRVFGTSAKGRAALASALEREDWSVQRDRPAFLTWLALSWQAKPGVVARQLARRKQFLQG